MSRGLSLVSGMIDAGVTGAETPAVGYVGAETVAGAATGGPIGALAAWGIAEATVQPIVRAGNIASLVSTGVTALSDIVAGKTDIGISYTSNSNGQSLDIDAQLGTSTLVSGALSIAGLIMPPAVELSVPLDCAAVTNDIASFVTDVEPIKFPSIHLK